MGKRTNTILQSAFFTLANIIPQQEAIGYMKDAATKSYLKKGQDIVDMNHRAIDAGATAFVKIDVPAEWATCADIEDTRELEGRPELVKQVREIMEPVGRMVGDSLPVSVFADHADGQFEQGAAAYEKRGVSVTVATWDASKCNECNNCSFVCPHATIRPFGLTEAEVAAAPAAMEAIPMKGKAKDLQYTLAISPLDCMGCGVCVGACNSGALSMVSAESQLPQQEVFDYCVAKVSDKPQIEDQTLRGSQFKQPLLEFSGACAGCAQTSYARLITQLYGDHMYISNATGCSSIWGGPAGTSPYTVNKAGHGPAWSNSLFEDNAEHGMGMLLGYEAVNNMLAADAEKLIEAGVAAQAAQAWLDARSDKQAARETADALIEALAPIAAGDGETAKVAQEILDNKAYLAKKSIWIFGGDGWAYDIGYGGLDHVLASGEDVNIFVFDTEVYSNTGGQASKASNIGQVAQFAAAGKEIKKKSLAEIAMAYGYVYVAQIAMGAKPAQTIKAITEAEAYHGPSLIIAYSPCEMHSIKGGMVNCQTEMKKAVDCGYWNLFRFNPEGEAGKKFVLDCKEPAGGYREFLMNEARYSRLTREFPERAGELFERNEQAAMDRYQHLLKLKAMYDAE